MLLKKYIVIFLLLAILQPKGNLFAQMRDENYDIPIALKMRVTSIESFIKRFNYEEDILGNALGKTEVTGQFVNERNQYILSLLDYERFRVASGAEKEKIIEFVKTINSTSQQVKLDFYDENWFAEVELDILYKKKPKVITLILKNEESAPRTSHWAIQSVRADFLDVKGSPKDSTHIIPPNSHGTDFIGLPVIFADKEFIGNYTSEDHEFDLMSVFLYAVKTGEIEFKMARKVTYHFLQIKDWIIKVKEFNRENSNSGYLVSELIKADNPNKDQYAMKLLNLH